jgi:hypothetical protein
MKSAVTCSQGSFSGGSRFNSVMASVTEDIRRERQQADRVNQENEPVQIGDPGEGDELVHGSSNMIHDVQMASQRVLTHREQNNRTAALHQGSSAELTGKLCQ